MYKNLLVYAVMLLAPCGIACADLTLVQVLEDLRSSSPSSKEQTTLFVSGKRIRFDQGQSLSSIILSDKKITFSIMHQSRNYVSLRHEGLEPDAPSSRQAPAWDQAKIQTTGNKETISGFNCHEVKITEKDGTSTEVWIADEGMQLKEFMEEFKFFTDFGAGFLSKQFEKQPQLRGVPIRVMEYEGGKMIRRATVQKLTRAPIPPSTFEVPAGYAELKPGEEPLPPLPQSPELPKELRQ